MTPQTLTLVQQEAERRYPTRSYDRRVFTEGAEYMGSIDGWIRVEDESRIMQKENDFLILFDTGEIRRYAEEDLPAAIITHWQPLPSSPDSK